MIDDIGRARPTTSVFSAPSTAAIAVDGTNWKTLYAPGALNGPTTICNIQVTVAGGWAGVAKIRIVNAAGTVKLWPFGTELVEGTDWASGVLALLDQSVEVSISQGYILQFRSSNAADGAGKTCALNQLGVVTRS